MLTLRSTFSVARSVRTMAFWAAWVAVSPGLSAQSAEPPPPPAFARAEARQRDADSVQQLTAEGRVLYERDTVKLTADLYCGQAIAYAERGWFRESIDAASKALYLGQRNKDAKSQANAKRDLAIAYNYAGDLPAAERYANEAIALGGDQPQMILAPANKVLGDIYARRGLAAKAIQSYELSLSQSSAKFRPLVLLSLTNVHINQKQPERARRTLAQAELSSNGSLRLQALRTEGNLLLAENKPDQALKVFTELGQAAKGSDADYLRVWALEGTGRARDALGDRKGALADYLAAAEAAESFRAKFRSEEFKTGLFGDAQSVFEQAITLLLADGRVEDAWDVSERSRARALLDSVRGRVQAPLTGSGSMTNPVGLAALRAQLAPNEVLLEFHSLPEKLLVWEIRRGGVKLHQQSVTKADLDASVTAFRDSIIKRRRAATELASGMRQTLLENVGLQKGERLIVVPHGSLHYLPFQALRFEDGWLIERHSVVLAPSGAIAVQLMRGDAPAGKQLAAFGNPEIDESYALPGAEKEVGEIAALFPDKNVFLRRQATRNQFLSNVNNKSIVHVAAHAEADAIDPLKSRILLSPGAQDTSSVPAYLFANEIYDLNLKNVSLVTISACESGLGRIAAGDEVLGFPRSFLTAGARGVISSLWPVSDESTEVLMTTFYKSLANGTAAADALRQGQLAVLNTRGSAHPFYWAPFNLIGDGRLKLSAG